MRLVIGNKAYSSWSLRGWLLIKATGLPFEEELVPLYEPGSKERMLAATPSGKVPCLIDGPVAVWDSLAILEYLNERLPQARLYPVDPAERAMHRSMVAEIHSGFSTIRTLCGMNLRRTPGPPPKSHTAELDQDIARLDAIAATLPAQRPGRQVGLNGLEAFLTPVAARFHLYQLPMSPRSAAVFGDLLAHPHFREWERAALQEPWFIPQYEAI